MAMVSPRTNGQQMKGGTNVGKYLTNKECVINGHKWRSCHKFVDAIVSDKVSRVLAYVQCAVCGDIRGISATDEEVYVRNANFDARKPVIAYRIRDDSDVPDIRINGEQAMVVSCSYQYVTSGPDQPGINCLVASIYLDSESKELSKPIMHTVSIDQRINQVFYQ